MTQFDFIRDYNQADWTPVFTRNRAAIGVFTAENAFSLALDDLYEIFTIIHDLRTPLGGKPRKLQSLYRQFDDLVRGKLKELIGAIGFSDFEKIFDSTNAKQREQMFNYLIDFAKAHSDLGSIMAVSMLKYRDEIWVDFLVQQTGLSSQQARSVSFSKFNNNPSFQGAWGIWQMVKPR